MVRLFRATLLVAWLAVAGWATEGGLSYYGTPLQERPFSDLYQTYKPSGTRGHLYGVIGTGLIVVGVTTYSLRKRVPSLARAGRTAHWLTFHIFLCTLGPYLIVLHTALRVGGIVSIAFWSMVIVALSGVFGRYVYVRIPKSGAGRFATRAAIEQERREVLEAIRREAGEAAEAIERLITPAQSQSLAFVPAVVAAVRYDLTRAQTVNSARRALSHVKLPTAAKRRALSLVQREVQLAHQAALLAPFQRVFRYWHILHVPLAITMAVVVTIHIGIAVAFGYGWSP